MTKNRYLTKILQKVWKQSFRCFGILRRNKVTDETIFSINRVKLTKYPKRNKISII